MQAPLWALLTVLLTVLAFPAADLGALGWIAAWPWCRLARASQGKRLFGWGYGAGALLLTLGCRWLSETTPLSLVGMVVFESLYYGTMVVLLRVMLVRGRWPAALALPAVYVAMEFGRRHFPFDGFPWLFLGYSQHGWTPVLQVADLGGVYLLTALLCVVAGSVEDLSRAQSARSRARRALPAVLVLLAAWSYGTLSLRDSLAQGDVPGPGVLAIQANVPQELKGRPIHEADMIRRHLEWTRRGLDEHPGEVDLVLWPETMVPSGYFGMEGAPADPRRHRDLVDQTLVPHFLRPAGAWILLGTLTGSFQGGQLNTAVLLDSEGREHGRYDKRYLVPGGEYLPLVSSLPEGLRIRIEDGIRSVTGGWLPALMPGRSSPVLEGPMGQEGQEPVRWGVTICYDIAYPQIGREAVLGGAQVLLNISNEAWFDGTAEFDQYTAMAAVRCAEVKRSMVRCANSGTSALIDPYGRVQALTDSAGLRHGFPGTLWVRPRLREGLTIYARFGDWCGWLALLLTAGLLTLGLLVRGRRGVTEGAADA